MVASTTLFLLLALPVWFESKTAKELHLKEVPGVEYGVLHAENLPPSETYSLYMQNGAGKSYYLGEVQTNKRGKAFFKSNHLQPIPLDLNPLVHRNFMLGERILYYLFPKCGREPLIATASPRALFYQWQDGAKVELYLLNRSATSFELSGTHFQPNEQLSTLLISSNEVSPGTLLASENGSFSLTLSPHAPGEAGGESSLTIQRTTSGESCTLPYLFGTAAQDEVNQLKNHPPPPQPAPNSLPALIDSPVYPNLPNFPDFSESDCVEH